MSALKTAQLRPRVFLAGAVLALAAIVLAGASGSASAKNQLGGGVRPTIVLLHGDWADASSWTSVLERLQGKGYTVVAPPNPLRGPTEDAPYVSSYLQTITGPIVLVAHSYGGFVATNAATGNPNVKALVYIDAFVPDEGDTLLDLTTTGKSCITQDALNPVPFDGGIDLYLRWGPNGDYAGYTQCFANGVSPKQSAVLFAEQRPASAAQFSEPSGPPAWKTIPSWALMGTQDHVIPLALQEQMTTRAGSHVSTVDAGHLSLITNPDQVTKTILTAVKATS